MRLPNGYGGVVNLGKKRRRPYAARITAGWTDEGKAIYKYLGYYAKKTEALQALAEYNNNPYNVDSRNLTFIEVYKMWSKKALLNCTRSRRVCYESALAKCSAIHNVKIKELKAIQMQKIIDSCEYRSFSSLNNIKTLFNQVCSFAHKNDFITKDYSSFITINDTSESKSKQPFTEKEIEILWQNKDDDIVKFALILIYTGFRITELLQLKNENIDLESGIMRGGIKTKAGKNRLVPVHNKIRQFIDELYNPEQEFLYDKRNSDIYRKEFKHKMKELGLNHTPHECRHTTATLLDKYNANPVAIKKLLGHSLKDVTSSVYIHKDLEELKKAINLIP